MLRHMESEECSKCPLFVHVKSFEIPEGAEIAWAVYRKLSRPAVDRFSLHREAWTALGLELEPDQMDTLIDQLSACEEGAGKARREIQAKKDKDAAARR